MSSGVFCLPLKDQGRGYQCLFNVYVKELKCSRLEIN